MTTKKHEWRKNLDLLIESRLKELIKETKNYDYAIKKSKDKGKAQIWVALALIYDKIKALENKTEKYNKKISEDELNKILKTIENL